MLFKIHRGKLLLALCQLLLARYHSKETPINALHVEKIAEAVLLYVLRIAFPATNRFKSVTDPRISLDQGVKVLEHCELVNIFKIILDSKQ